MTKRLTARAREMRELLCEQAESGLSLRDFARRERIPETTLAYWKRQLRLVGAALPAEDGFLPVSLVAARTAAGCASFELKWPGGRQLSVPAGFDERELRRLVGLLESC